MAAEATKMITQPTSGITFLKTRDLETTTGFYTTILGFDYVLDQGSCRIFRICPSCYLGFCLTEGETGSGEVIITLEVADVDSYCAALEASGVEIEVRPRLNPKYQIYQMFIRDPNGYLVEIQRFLDPRWHAPK